MLQRVLVGSGPVFIDPKGESGILFRGSVHTVGQSM